MKIFAKFAVGLALSAGLASIAAAADPYPSRPIKLVVPFGAGSGADIVARQIGQAISVELQQVVVVENQPGAGGNIAAGSVARATPDGYTIMLGSSGPLTVNPALYASVPFDPVAGFTPISVVAIGPMVFAVRSDSEIRTLADLVAVAKKSKNPLSYGSSGVGSGPHLAALLLEQSAGISMTHIPYKGTADAVNDLLGGHLDLAISGVPTALPFMKANRIRLLAATSASSDAALKDVPTTSNAGFKDTDLAVFYGVVAPGGTPDAIVATLNRAIAAAVAKPETQKIFSSLGLEAHPTSPGEFLARIRTDLDRWTGVIKEAGITAD